jgi:hypothetical protein
MEVSEDKIERGRDTIGGWLSTWDPKRRESICRHMVNDEWIVLKEAVALYPFKATYPSIVVGEYARIRLGISTILLAIGSKEEPAPISEILDATERMINALTDKFYEDEKKRWRKYGLRKRIEQELQKWINFGCIDKVSEEKIRVEPIVPELIVLDHFGPEIYKSCGLSSWKRAITSGVVGASRGGVRFSEIPTLVRDFYSGKEYNYQKSKDLERWWRIHGPEGSMFAIKAKDGYVYLQYNKKAYGEEIEIDSPKIQSMMKVVRDLPFTDVEQLIQYFGSEAYLSFLEVSKKYPEFTPLRLSDCFVSQGLAFQLGLGLKEPLEEKLSEIQIWAIYKECKPRLEEVEDFGITIRNVLHELAVNQQFIARDYRERLICGALAKRALVEQKQNTDTFVVKPGMREAVATFSRFSGNIYDR